ncbi:hypothetical protein EUGRSUZ_K00572 [Eucalyptus grandis]|uniref:Uncharacterized protein n=2 Tax=Eucalyptus grandis TaxID=71139 RepID=A0ACC3IR65_EUCGR|nr:hypothetical protein EUGRSUZ_K00572 [Eucalyptus grandis]
MHVATNTTSHAEAKDKAKKSKEDEKTNTVPFHKLFLFADFTDMVLMLVGTMGAVGNGLAMPLMTVLFGQLIDSFGANQHNKDVVHRVSKISLKFIYLAAFTGVMAFLQVTFWMVTGERQAARIRGLYLRAILRQDIAFFDKETNKGEVVGRMSGDTVLKQDAMGEKVGKFIQLMSTFFGGFVIAFIKGWLLTLVMLSSIPPIVVSGGFMSLIIAKMASRGQSIYAKASNVVEQTIGSIRTVASFTGEKLAIANYNEFLEDAYKSGIHEGMAAGLGVGTAFLILFFSYALAVWFGGKMILEKGYTGGEVLNVIMAVLAGSMSLGQASPCLSAFATGQAAAFKMIETINRKPEIDSCDTRGKTLNGIRGDITLKDVYFSYPARPDELIFNRFSLYIPSGMTAALVGQSGSGKSTVISLIERFYDPQAGEVLIDGVNLKDFQLKWIRSKIGLVSQEPVLFASSIKDNILYGKENATIEEIRAATELANAAKFIDKLPKGLDTMVGEHGTQLSGGQKQRVAIARAILKDPRILLLDEATSALDAESEKIVQEALDRIMANRTTTVALVGESGSGKSTVIALLQRFYDPDSGHITLDGIEIQKLQLKWFRQQMGLVSQEPVLFNDTIRANIAYGKDGEATEAEILAASELANAHKFISSLQQGYDTLVGERGVQLSGGQKQRVAIARAIVKDPKILLLDEATSALDAEAERVVQDALDKVMANRTTVIVAHRLSTIKNADVIAVVKDGVIIEKGKHDSLINIKDGFYASLVSLHISAVSS